MACLLHKWDGCICLKCGKTRHEGHLYENVPGKCQKKCAKCGFQVQIEHTWNGLKCDICGERTSYVKFDSLNEKELVLFTSTVIDSTNKWISATNVTDKKKDELRTFLPRFEKASSATDPLSLIIEDSVIALDRICCLLRCGVDETNSGIEVRQETTAKDMEFVKSTFGGLEGYHELVRKLIYDISRYKTLPSTESNMLPIPCAVVITRPKLFSSGPKNNTKTTVFMDATEIGSFIAGETLTASTNVSENLISCSGNDDPPISFKAQSGGEMRFIINPGFTSIEAFAIAPDS